MRLMKFRPPNQEWFRLAGSCAAHARACPRRCKGSRVQQGPAFPAKCSSMPPDIRHHPSLMTTTRARVCSPCRQPTAPPRAQRNANIKRDGARILPNGCHQCLAWRWSCCMNPPLHVPRVQWQE